METPEVLGRREEIARAPHTGPLDGRRGSASSLPLVIDLDGTLVGQGSGVDVGRGYQPDDLKRVSNLGSSSGHVAVLVLALYIQDGHTAAMYGEPRFIWLACPLLLYWISRAWLVAHRGQMHDDPLVFALEDRASWVVIALLAATFVLARVVT